MSSPSVLWDASQGADTPTASLQCGVWQLSSRCTFRTVLPPVVFTNKQKHPNFLLFWFLSSCFKNCAVFNKNKSLDQRENSTKHIVENYLKCFSGLKVEFDTLWYDIWADSGLICFDQHLRVCKDYWTSELVLIRKRWREKTKPEYWKNINHYPHSAVTSFLFWN